MEEQPPIRRVAVNILNKQSRTADKGWSSSLGVGLGTNKTSPSKKHVKKYSQGEMLPLEKNNPEVNYSPSRISGGECF
jgi:hypothetical protein